MVWFKYVLIVLRFLMLVDSLLSSSLSWLLVAIPKALKRIFCVVVRIFRGTLWKADSVMRDFWMDARSSMD